MRFAYADPPYLGQCRQYDHYHPDGRCWDDLMTHALLIDRLNDEFTDGWAMSASVPSLWDLLPLIDKERTRICIWAKTFSAFKRGVRPAYAWEPVIVRGGRNPHNGYSHPPPLLNGEQTTPKDFVECWTQTEGIFAPITLQKGLTGAKPEKVCEAILGWLNFQPNDELVDLFPGTGVMTELVVRCSR